MITTVDQAGAGARPPFPLVKVGGTMEAVGVMHSLFYTAGGAAAAPTPGLAGAHLTSYPGQIPFSNPLAGQETSLLRLSATASGGGKLLLLDRLWHNSGLNVTTTTAQTINSGTWQPRCPPATGRTPNTLGRFIMVGLEVSQATTNAGAITNATLSYTDSDGNAGAVATMPSFPATAAAGTFVPFLWAAGDIGIQSIQSCTLGTSLVTGTVHLVAYRVIAELQMPELNKGYAIDWVTSGAPQFYDNTVPFLLWHPNATAGVSLNGTVIFTQG
jgi:hypothetical protein